MMLRESGLASQRLHVSLSKLPISGVSVVVVPGPSGHPLASPERCALGKLSHNWSRDLPDRLPAAPPAVASSAMVLLLGCLGPRPVLAEEKSAWSRGGLGY